MNESSISSKNPTQSDDTRLNAIKSFCGQKESTWIIELLEEAIMRTPLISDDHILFCSYHEKFISLKRNTLKCGVNDCTMHNLKTNVLSSKIYQPFCELKLKFCVLEKSLFSLT